MTLSNLLRSDSPESVTRLSFLLLTLSVIGWEWWAVIHNSDVPGLVEILGFMALSMGWKQYTEVKRDAAANNPVGQ